MTTFEHVLAQNMRKPRRNKRNVSFLLEAMIILALFMACMSVFIQILSSAQLQGRTANIMSEAVLAATNRAEEFCANPTSNGKTTKEGELTITCMVDSAQHDAGILYSATITVCHEQQVVYTLRTARYVHDAGGDAV